VIGVFIALGLIVVVAAAVLIYVAYPGRGRTAPRAAQGAAAALGRLVEAVAPEPSEVPPEGLLGNPDTDAAMRRRVEKVERGLTAPFAKAGDLIKDAADYVMPVDGGKAAAGAGRGRRQDERVEP
jgi:hypothetical protein